jgi:hypothetical protein
MVAVRRQNPILASEVGCTANERLYAGRAFLGLILSNLARWANAAQNVQPGTLRRDHLTRPRDKLRRERPIHWRWRPHGTHQKFSVSRPIGPTGVEEPTTLVLPLLGLPYIITTSCTFARFRKLETCETRGR